MWILLNGSYYETSTVVDTTGPMIASTVDLHYPCNDNCIETSDEGHLG